MLHSKGDQLPLDASRCSCLICKVMRAASSCFCHFRLFYSRRSSLVTPCHSVYTSLFPRILLRLLANTLVDVMDQRMLLALQYAANQAGTKLPWAQAGRLVAESITEGAIVQHLAKLRARLLEKGERVPPVLKRGGGYAPAAAPSKVTKTKVKAKKSSKGMSTVSDSDDDEGEEDHDATDSQRAKNTPNKGKGKVIPKKMQRKPRSVKTFNIKQESSGEEEPLIAVKARGKRPCALSQDDSDYEKQKKSSKFAKNQTSITRRGQLSHDDDEDDGGDWEEMETEDEEEEQIYQGGKTVAAGAPFLEQESDFGDNYPSDDPLPETSVARLPIGRGRKAKKVLRKLGYGSEESNSQPMNGKPVYPAKPVNSHNHQFDKGPESNLAHDGLTAFSASTNVGGFPNEFGGLPLKGNMVETGQKGYATSGHRSVGGHDNSVPSASAAMVMDYDYPAYGHQAYQYGSNPFDGGHDGNLHESGFEDGAHRADYAQPAYQSGHNYPGYAVPQQANVAAQRDPFFPAATTNTFPNPGQGSFGQFDPFALGNHEYFNFQGGMQGGDGNHDIFGDFGEGREFDEFLNDLGFAGHEGEGNLDGGMQ